MHQWSKEGVDWSGINDAADWIGEQLVRWGRIRVSDTKEKFGTVRVYCSFGWYQLHSVVYPRHHYSQFPNWLWSLDCKYLSRLMPLVNWAVVPWQQLVYAWVYVRAIRKWPHLWREITAGMDYPELLR